MSEGSTKTISRLKDVETEGGWTVSGEFSNGVRLDAGLEI